MDISGRPRTKQCAAQRVPASQAFILFGALSTSSWGASVGDSCLPRENSGPYVSYVTSEVFTLPAAGRPLIPVRWYALDKVRQPDSGAGAGGSCLPRRQVTGERVARRRHG